MSEFIKTTSMGIVCPIIKEGDDLKQIVVNSLLQASKDNFEIQDRDVLAITESVVARAQTIAQSMILKLILKENILMAPSV